MALQEQKAEGSFIAAGHHEYYLHGGCHIFALAAADLLGVDSFLVLHDTSALAWESECDPDDVIFNVAHVYALMEDTAIDATGIHDRSMVTQLCKERYGTEQIDESVLTRGELIELTENRSDDLADFMPLAGFSYVHLMDARDHVSKAFPDLPCHERQESLVLVHPGSLFGSAEFQVGKMEARAARDGVTIDLDDHDGPVVVIDGFLSDEITGPLAESIDACLERASVRGYFAARIWGCDAGEPPFDGWKDLPFAHPRRVFDGQANAILDVANWFPDGEIRVTGAWATPDHSSGCASDVLLALRGHFKSIGRQDCTVEMSERALEEPEEEADEDLEDTPDP